MNKTLYILFIGVSNQYFPIGQIGNAVHNAFHWLNNIIGVFMKCKEKDTMHTNRNKLKDNNGDLPKFIKSELLCIIVTKKPRRT